MCKLLVVVSYVMDNNTTLHWVAWAVIFVYDNELK